jgi:hypothetical protein
MAFPETIKVDEPGYWAWVSHIMRRWEPPADVKSFTSIVGFAVLLGSFSNRNNPVQVSYEVLAKRAHMSPQQARRLAALAIDVGLFAATGPANPGKTPVLRRALPGCQCVKSDTGRVKSDTDSVKSDPMIMDDCPTVPGDNPRSPADSSSENRDYNSVNNSEPESPADELRRLVCESPDTHTLESLWEHHRPEWTDELTELAKLRRAELAG